MFAVIKMVIFIVFAACSVAAEAQSVGEKAKLNHVVLFDGSRFDPATVAGKPTLVYFWASWCPRCRNEMRALENYYQSYKDKGFSIVAINFRDKIASARALIESVRPISFPVGIINDEWKSDYPKLYGTPTWFLLDKQGVIRKVIVGREIIDEALEVELKKILADG